MAKRDGSKSAAVRDYLAKYPDARPKEVYDALTKQGLKLSLALVNAVKYSKPKTSRRASQPNGSIASASNGEVSAADLIATKQIVDSLGGVAQTKDVLDLLEQLK